MSQFMILFVVALAYGAIAAEELRAYQPEQSGRVSMISTSPVQGHNSAGRLSLPDHISPDVSLSGKIIGQAAAAIQAARTVEKAASIANADAIQKTRALEAARTAYLSRAQVTANEMTRNNNAANRAAAAIALELQRANTAGIVGTDAHLQGMFITDFVTRQAHQRAILQQRGLLHKDMHGPASGAADNGSGH